MSVNLCTGAVKNAVVFPSGLVLVEMSGDPSCAYPHEAHVLRDLMSMLCQHIRCSFPHLLRCCWSLFPPRGVQSQLNACLKGRAVLVFHGVDSAFHVWVNGVMMGFAKGSRLPCEFDVTDALAGAGIQVHARTLPFRNNPYIPSRYQARVRAA